MGIFGVPDSSITPKAEMSTDSFIQAQERVETLTARPTNDELLNLYGLFKQATLGDCLQRSPGIFDLKGQAKWKAWMGRKGMPTADAADAYVKAVDDLLARYPHKD